MRSIPHDARPSEHFLSFSKTELCAAEPHLKVCQPNGNNRAQSSKIINGDGLTAERLEQLSKHSNKGFIEEEGNTGRSSGSSDVADPFDEVATRSPPSSSDYDEERYSRRRHRKKHRKSHRGYYGYGSPYTQYYQQRHDPSVYRVYPGLHPKDGKYCSDMKAMFAYTCAPSKPLRIDLVEFCKDYAAFCNVPNFHRLPGPRMGPPLTDKGVGHVDVNGHFGFGVGAVPGLEVGVGWGVDVGPIPGMGESVGVGVGLDLGIMGSKTPEAFRRGQDDPNAKGGGIVGINGGVGVKAPGTGDGVGVGTGLGVGK
ncbi:Protein CBG03211 [Caenorhabditis briggsae]|uniref:Protein CBG03211 n=1 Tax=Caenorhabditis briggsae TaxID=6238 RepID=A8WSJ7_CAEBR|nr:Protein CBG03211 [Caenorhabditis briggsae]CAP23456.1 Protein CBG03211 [Caenorhabditis briggsae]